MSSSSEPLDAARRRIEERLAHPPALQPAVVEILSCDPRSNEFPERVQGLVERHRPLASRILAMANGMDPGYSEPVLTLPQAIARVGTRRVARLVIVLALLREFPPDSEPLRDLWRHSLRVATAAREIARVCGRTTDSDEAYVSGLLHDVGRFVLFEPELAETGAGEQEGWDSSRDLLGTERRLSGHDHVEVGERLCRLWGLRDDIVQIVRLHHCEPDQATGLSERMLDTLRIVQQADRLTSLLQDRPGFEELPASDRLALLEGACVHPEWNWTPAGPTHLDLLVGPILSRGDERLAALGLVPT